VDPLKAAAVAASPEPLESMSVLKAAAAHLDPLQAAAVAATLELPVSMSALKVAVA